MLDHLTRAGIVLNDVSTNEHVPEIERLICVIKERIRCKLLSLPFAGMPKLMKKHLFLHVVSWLNMFPRRGGISDTLSPRAIIHGTNPNYDTMCRVPFGAYCQVHDEPSPSNTTTPRTTPALALNARGNLQGGYNFISLETWQLLTWRQWTELPMPPEVIVDVHTRVRHELKLADNVSLPSVNFRRHNRTLIPDYPPLPITTNHPLDIHQQNEGAMLHDANMLTNNETQHDDNNNDDNSMSSSSADTIDDHVIDSDEKNESISQNNTDTNDDNESNDENTHADPGAQEQPTLFDDPNSNNNQTINENNDNETSIEENEVMPALVPRNDDDNDDSDDEDDDLSYDTESISDDGK
jgi:hypothetical protein